MLPKDLCRRDVPDLGEAITASDYAQIEGLSEADVIKSIHERRLLGAQFQNQWYVEAPPFCEERLRKLHPSQATKAQASRAAAANWAVIAGDSAAQAAESARVVRLGSAAVVCLSHPLPAPDGQLLISGDLSCRRCSRAGMFVWPIETSGGGLKQIECAQCSAPISLTAQSSTDADTRRIFLFSQDASKLRVIKVDS